jgi:hypothetical protein
MILEALYPPLLSLWETLCVADNTASAFLYYRSFNRIPRASRNAV